jgi:hypothetical protein
VTVDGTITAATVITAADGADVTANYEIFAVDGALVIEPDTSAIDGLTAENVTEEDKAAIEAVIAMMESAESLKPEWEQILATCQALMEALDAGARVGEVRFATLAEAIETAEAGDTIVLLKDMKEASVVLIGGNTLDLNGNTLEVEEYVAIYGDTKENVFNQIVDNAGGGLLKVSRDRIMIQNKNQQLPVWDEVNQGYAFISCPKFNQKTTSLTNGAKFTFLPYLGISAYELIARGAASSGVELQVKVTWNRISDGMPAEMFFVYSDQLMQKFLDSYNPATGKFGSAFALTLTGTDSVENLQFHAVFVSDTGVEYECK